MSAAPETNRDLPEKSLTTRALERAESPEERLLGRIEVNAMRKALTGRDAPAAEPWGAFMERAGLGAGNELAIRTALSGGEVAGGLYNQFAAQVLAGYNAASDTTAGWVRPASLPNFRSAPIGTSQRGARLKAFKRGGCAENMSIQIQSENWRLARYTARFTIDAVDLIDAEGLSILQLALRDVGAAARSIVPDLVYSSVLDNSALADGTVLFHSSRKNLGPGALAGATLEAGMGAIGGQVLLDDRGAPIHENLGARFLIVPPQLLYAGKALAREISTGDDTDLVVRSESRLSAAGVLDPRSDGIVAGTATNYLLAARAEQAPSIVVGYLDGVAQPSIRSYALDGGQWGAGIDIVFDVGICPVDGRPLYFSTGL